MKKQFPVLAGFLAMTVLSAATILQSQPSINKAFKEQQTNPYVWYQNGQLHFKCKLDNGKATLYTRTLNVAQLPKDYTFSIDMTVQDWMPGKGHFGIIAGKNLFVVRNVIAWKKDPKTGEKVASNESFTVGKSIKLVFVVENGSVKIFVNGVRKNDIPCGGYENKISFYAYGVNAIVHSVKLDSGNTMSSVDSRNLFRNASFETSTNDEYPDYWGTRHWGLSIQGDQFRSQFRPDKHTAFDGDTSFRIETGAKFDYQLCLVSCVTQIPRDKDLVFSIYAKASKPNAIVQIGAYSNPTLKQPKTFKIGTKWTRLVVRHRSPGIASERIMIQPISANTVFYFDAAQLEEGKEATPFRLHQNELVTQQKEEKVPVFSPVLSAEKITINGILDEPIWKNQKPIELRNIKKPEVPCMEKTLLRMACDSENLYFAVECFSKDPSKLVANVKKHKGQVWKDDCVEFFLRQGKNSNSYCQFIVNPINTRYEGAAMADIAWNAFWETGVKIGKDRYVVEARIPISSLFAGVVQDVYFNVGRENRVTKENSAIAAPSQTFLYQKNYPELKLPIAIKTISASDYRFEYTEFNSNEREFSCRIASTLSKDEHIKAVVQINNITKEQHFIAKNGEQTIRFPGFNIPADKAASMQIALRGAKDKLWFRNAKVFAKTTPFKLIPEFSWFAGEKNFRFRLQNMTKQKKSCKAFWQVKQNGKILSSGKFNIKPEEMTVFAVPALKQTGDFTIEVLDRDTQKLITSTVFSAAGKNWKGSRTNRFRKVLITPENKELFMWSLYCEGDSYKELPMLQREAGINHINKNQLWLSDKGFHEVYQLCQKLGIYVAMGFSPSAKMTERLKQALKYKSFMEANIQDEAASRNVSAEQIKEHADYVRKIAGRYLLISRNENILGIMRHSDFSASDVVSVDHYTIPELDIRTITNCLLSMKEDNPDKVLVYVAQSCGNAYNYGREPTAAEIMNQAYQAFACEVWNVAFFANVPLSKQILPAMKQAKNERDEIIINDDFISWTPVKVKCSSPEITLTARRRGKKVTVITVNRGRTPILADFSIPYEKIGKGEVRFENRSIKQGATRWQDSFKPLERHVYTITLK